MSSYMDSQIKWINEIPSDWTIKKVKNIFSRRKEVNTDDDPVILSLARDGVKVRDISTNEGQLAESYDNYHKVYPGDLMLNPMDLVSGANCSLSEVSGVISPAYINLAKKQDVNPKYFDYFFKYLYWAKVMFIHGKGVSFDNRWTLNSETVMDISLPVPPLTIQNDIVNYLNRKCKRIDGIISENQHSIDLIEEYKRSIIFEAVTHGLNKNINKKKCNIEGIDEIPETWNVNKVKYLCDYYNGVGHEGEQDYDGSFILVNSKFVSTSGTVKKYTENQLFPLLKEDVCIVLSDLPKGRALARTYYVEENDRYTLNQRIAALRSKSINAKYLAYFMDRNLELLSYDDGVNQTNLKKENILNCKVLVPPTEEQEKIVEYLDKNLKLLDRAIKYRKRIIEKLEEYKKSLIYECVTGKREV